MKTQQAFKNLPNDNTMTVDCESSTGIAELLYFPEVDRNQVWVRVTYQSGGSYCYNVPFMAFYSNLHFAIVDDFVATVINAQATVSVKVRERNELGELIPC